jgi:hypothetical protein
LVLLQMKSKMNQKKTQNRLMFVKCFIFIDYVQSVSFNILTFVLVLSLSLCVCVYEY